MMRGIDEIHELKAALEFYAQDQDVMAIDSFAATVQTLRWLFDETLDPTFSTAILTTISLHKLEQNLAANEEKRGLPS